MKKYILFVGVHGRTVQETQEQQSLISIQHNAAITAAPSDSDVQRTLNTTMSNILKHAICYVMLLAVSLLGCGSDEQMPVEEEAENIQIDEVQVVEVAPEPIPAEIQIPEGMVYVPAGAFIMGSDPDVDPMTDALDELPQHKVFLDAYFIDKHEVSNADYTQFVEATGHRNSIFWDNPKFNHPDQPVVGVTWG